MPETRVIDSSDLVGTLNGWLEGTEHENFAVRVHEGKSVSVANYATPDPIDAYFESDEFAADQLFGVQVHQFKNRSDTQGCIRSACESISGRVRVGTWLRAAFDAEVFEPLFVAGVAGKATALAANAEELHAPPRNAPLQLNVHLQLVRESAAEEIELIIEMASDGRTGEAVTSEFAKVQFGVGEWDKSVINLVKFSAGPGPSRLSFSHSGNELCSLPITIVEI